MLDIKITRTATPKAKPTDETKLGFGKKFSDHMFVMDYTEGEGWHDARIVPYGPFELHPATVVFHYAQEIFEGMKAYRTADDTVQLFRPDCNAKRFQDSADRLCIPQIPVEDYIQAVEALVDVDRDWVPHTLSLIHIGGDVVQDGVAEHIVFCLPSGHIPGIFAQNHSQFAFVVQLLHKVSVSSVSYTHLLTIAHRLTTIKDYDRILVLGEEGIVESGTHDQLRAKQGVYYRLWNQLPGEDTL